MSCCSGVGKVIGVRAEDPEAVEEFIREEFSGDDRINLSQMIKWGRHSERVSNFMQLIRQNFTLTPTRLLSNKVYLTN